MYFSKTDLQFNKRPVTRSEYTRCEINHLRLLNYPIETLHKRLMRRVRPHIVLPIGLVLKLNYKDMRDSVLRLSVRPYNRVQESRTCSPSIELSFPPAEALI
jgi:hypothetical protein